MKITEGQLRKIVREEILRESAYGTPGGKEVDELLGSLDATFGYGTGPAWNPTGDPRMISLTFDPGIRRQTFLDAIEAIVEMGFRVDKKWQGRGGAGALVYLPDHISLEQ